MNLTESLGRLREIAAQVSEREGCLLYDIEFAGAGKHRVLRVFIDKSGPVKDSHVSVDQCANVSRALSLLLDVEDLVPGGAYDLEVSSPGLERILREKWHFEKVVGENIKVKTKDFVKPEDPAVERGPTKSLGGTLIEVVEQGMRVSQHEVPYFISWENLAGAHLVFDMTKNKGTKTKHK